MSQEKEFDLGEKIQSLEFTDDEWYIPIEDVKEFIKWVETEIIMKSPKARQNLIKLRKRVGDKLMRDLK